MLSLNPIEFIYEPYPIGIAYNVFDRQFYQSLIADWPSFNLFTGGHYRGVKYGLSEHDTKMLNGNVNAEYLAFVGSHYNWSKFRTYIKSQGFVDYIINVLNKHNINLKRHQKGKLSARFEFSAIPVDGGCLDPHTDSPQKIITLVIPIYSYEWPVEFGGGTAVLKPKDVSKTFDYANDLFLKHDEVKVVHTFPFVPNSCIVFIKTYNSLHGIPPMLGHGSKEMRKSLTINIEKMDG